MNKVGRRRKKIIQDEQPEPPETRAPSGKMREGVRVDMNHDRNYADDSEFERF